MSFDGFFLHHMTEELRRELLGGRIQKINQPFEQELVLQIRAIAKATSCSYQPTRSLGASS